ncbi:MAG: hypothetical protein M2R46_05451 [Verrucomicrobia subdivision 3 bacterium]|nr:hypothetical protein [Limisphaerales bacterium]
MPANHGRLPVKVPPCRQTGFQTAIQEMAMADHAVG